MPAKKRRSPREKKQLSLEKDRRNMQTATTRGKRKSIPASKARVNENYRRRTRQALKDGLKGDPEAAADKAGTVRREKWKKSPDLPLREAIGIKKERRDRWHGGRKKHRERMAFEKRIFEETLEAVRGSGKYRNASKEKTWNVAFTLAGQWLKRHTGELGWAWRPKPDYP